MLLNHLDYDPAALKARLVQRHGSDVGQIVFDAEQNRRRLQDAQHIDLSAELATIHSQMSEQYIAAGQEQQKLQSKLEATYHDYLEQCAEAATSDSLAQSKIAPLAARSQEIQHQMRTLVQPRFTERELQEVAIYNSMDAGVLRSVDRRLPPLASQPLSELALINLGYGKPRI